MARPLICFVALWTMVAGTNDWTGSCNKCKCVWANGKRTADCTGTGLNDIPTDMSSEIREIDFSNNPLYGLSENVFSRAKLADIHKLKLQNCSVQEVHKTAFKGLLLLIELDLSKNSISILHKLTFRDNVKIRVLSLSYNQITALEQHLFYNLTHLQKVLLNNNRIEYIEDDVFVLLPVLQHINLGYNRLKTIKSDFTENLIKLNSLNLEGNPWICDCHLQDFRDRTLRENLITTRTECDAPFGLKGKVWTDSSVVFACLPQIIEPLPSTEIEATAVNVTLTCRVRGEPEPDVDWVSNGRIIDRDPRQSTQRFSTSKRKIGEFTYNNLTIFNVNYRDKGEYKCVAKNPGGTDEKNVTLIVSVARGVGGSPIPLGDALPLVIGLSVGAVVILVIILVLICCYCNRRSTHGMSSKERHQTSDEGISLNGQPEMEKALITDVNPVIKPPRASSVQQSVTSGGTEVSEVKKNLLDNDSVFAPDEESRSLDFEMHNAMRRSQNLLEQDYRPDLVRIYQVSPAGSSASTVADTTRLPPHHGPQSPMHSPIYDTVSLYRTLPYSRSQSPFVGAAPRIPRQGYVTIPRRPRHQSWSSEPPPSGEGVAEPLYDNLGLRTTVDGSSALSLNKIEASTPKSARMFPLSPSCDPIAEHDPVLLSPASRTGWAKANAEALRSPEQATRRNSMPSYDENKAKKVAPIPPPKPKKRTSTGPLFEDEGEDGTEV